MTTRPCLRYGPVAVALCAAAAFAQPSVESVFQSLYGDELARVQSTITIADDLDLAARLVEAASVDGINSELADLLCVRALELAENHPDGYAAASDALVRLQALRPDEAAALRDRRIDLAFRAYSRSTGDARRDAAAELAQLLLDAADAQQQAGDLPAAVATLRRADALSAFLDPGLAADVDARGKELIRQLRVERRIESLNQRLGGPQDAAIHQTIAELYFFDLDQPDHAVEHAEKAGNDDWVRTIGRLGEDPAELPADQLSALGDWLRAAAAGRPEPARHRLLSRAAGYYGAFLERPDQPELARTKAALALKQINEQIGVSGDSVQAAPGEWVNLLPKVDAARDAVRGTWQLRGGELNGSGSGMIFRLPVEARGSYEIEAAVARRGPASHVGFRLPVGDRRVVGTFGLRMAREQMARLTLVAEGDNPAASRTMPMPGFPDDKTVVIGAKVEVQGKAGKITLTLEGRKVLEWQGPLEQLSVSSYWGAGADKPNPAIIGEVAAKVTAVRFRTTE